MASSIVTAHLGESVVTKGLAVYTTSSILYTNIFIEYSPIEARKVCTSGIYINGGEYVLHIDR